MDIEYDISLCLDTPMGLEELRTFIAAVEAHSEPAAYEVLAQPADFRPESPAGWELQDDWPNLRLLPRPEPNRRPTRQPAANRIRLLNQAINQARGRYPAPWSPAVLPLTGCLPTLVEFMDEETETAAAAPRLVNQQGDPIAGRRRLPGLPTLLLLHTPLGQTGLLGGMVLKHHYYAELPPVLSQATAEFLNDRALLLRRPALEEVGGFDPAFHHRYADADFCRRAARMGWYCHYLATAVARETQPWVHQVDYLRRQPQPGHLADAGRLLLKKWGRRR
ncbi:MAG: hypothetical protein U5J62_04690 [Desulfurivibrio sp.]|nr:hypothetical protein [Desulfurivibrio sp.]